MKMAAELLDARMREALREYDVQVARLVGQSHHALYQLARMTAEKIAPMDSFYVGFFCPGQMIVFPYNYDVQEYDDPEAYPYAADGLASWALNQRRRYLYQDDDGERMYRGHTFGDTERLSADCLLVPIFEGGRANARVTGVMSMLSYESGVYGEPAAVALSWVAQGLAVAIEREEQDVARRRNLEGMGGWSPDSPPDTVIDRALEKLASIRRRAQSLHDLVPAGASDLALAVEALCEECQSSQTEIVELLYGSGVASPNPLHRLTQQETKLVERLIEGFNQTRRGYSTRELAAKMVLSEGTVKVHIRNTMRKLGVATRKGAVDLARYYLPHHLNSSPKSTPKR